MSQTANSRGEPFRIITVDQVIREIAPFNHFELHPHCTDSPNIRDHWARTPDGIYWQTVMRRVHMGGNRNWDDIAQHYTLLPNGLFVTGRYLGSLPCSIAGWNGSRPNRIPLMVEMMGNFNPGIDELVGEQRRSILQLTKHFLDQGKYIRFHNEHSSKTCPGRLIVKSTFLAEARAFNPASAPAQKPVEEDIWMKGVVTGIASTLNVRSGPSTAHSRVGTLTNGAQLDIFEYRDGWFRVKSGAQTGWVSGLYVKLLDVSAAPAVSEAEMKKLQEEITALKAQVNSLQSEKNQVQTLANARLTELSRYEAYIREGKALMERVK